MTATLFTFGISVHSYYAWNDPVIVLEKIRNCLAPGADFILATPNPSLDMRKLMQDSQQGFPLNPDFRQFRQCNDQLAQAGAQQFVTIHTLVGQLRSLGFSIQQCHSRYFDGGVNFVHARIGERAGP